ncbi:MAG: RNA 2',3'-cyclic phosphodiesterase [Dehalococcoidia bacterium]
MLRLFIALELPEEMKLETRRFQERLRGRIDTPLRWVRPEGIHLTLKFLGAVEEARVPEIEAGLNRAAVTVQPMKVGLGEPGVFGGRRPRVVWIGLGGDLDRLGSLQRAVEREIAPLGFPTEAREFNPHLTLARVPENADRRSLAAIPGLLQAIPGPNAVDARLATISLMRSEPRPGGARYTGLTEFPLGH